MKLHLEITHSNSEQLAENNFDSFNRMLSDPNEAVTRAYQVRSHLMWEKSEPIFIHNVPGIDPTKAIREQVRVKDNIGLSIGRLTSDRGVQRALYDGLDTLANAAITDFYKRMAAEGHHSDIKIEKIVMSPGKDGKVNCQVYASIMNISELGTGEPKPLLSSTDPENPLIRTTLTFSFSPNSREPTKIKPITDAKLTVEINANMATQVEAFMPKTRTEQKREQELEAASQGLQAVADQLAWIFHKKGGENLYFPI